MNKFYTLYICILFFTATSGSLFAQKFGLKLASKDSLEHLFLQDVNYQKNHTSKENLVLEVHSISENLKTIGYFTNTVDSITKRDSIYTGYFSLGKKIDKAFITINSDEVNLSGYIIKNSIAEIEIKNLSNFLTSISNKLDEQGKSFSEVSLKNINLKENFLFAEVNIKQSKQRTIDKVIIKGYEEFPSSFVTNFLDVKKGTVFNQQKLTEISSAIKSLKFVSEIKPPEVLFSKDSTLLYMYLKKERVNTFDGLLNFASKENEKGLLFNGHVNLELNNILNSGERFELLWKANGEERQEFDISTEIPYIFNSAFTPTLAFSIYKQDSTFLNTKFKTDIGYNINSNIIVAATFNSETSNNTLQENTNTSIQDFNNSFLGLQFSYKNRNVDEFYININPSFGKRKSDDLNESQFKIDFEASYLWKLNQRNSVFIRNKTGYLNSDTYFENELYRIGGANSMRGFNEQSLFTSQFSYLNIEYRYLTSNNSYFYTITDLGRIKTIQSKNENLYGLGLGYLFNINNSQLNLGYVIGKSSSTSFDLDQSKLIISVVTFF